MQTLRICAVGLPTDSLRVFLSMLKVVEGRSRAAWQVADLAQADVLLAHAGADANVLATWDRTGKPAVLVVDEHAAWVPSRFVLRQPFRVMQLLSLLDDVSDSLSRPRQTAGPTDLDGWAAGASLRALMARSGERGWHLATDCAAHQVWMGPTHASALPATLAALRQGALELGAFAPADPPPAAAQSLPITDLAWLIGLHGPAGLAPWLSNDATYQLSRWPDVARLGAEVALVDLCAHAAILACTPAQLVTVSEQPADAVYRFLAAASLARVVSSAAVGEKTPAASAPATSARGWSRLLSGLRRHLRLAA